MNKRMVINLISSLAVFISNLAISFFLTPYIVAQLGQEVYGFVGLANNFTSYISLVVTAITGMLSRYITIEYAQKNYDNASGYFSTAVIAKSVIALLASVPLLFIAANIQNVVNISPEIVPDVRILWILVFAEFLLNLPFGSFGIASFVKNRLEISSAIKITTSLLRSGILLVTFVFFTPHIWYIGLASIAAGVFTVVTNIIQARRLMPEVKLDIKKFDFKYVYNLVIVGIWNALNKLQQILISGLDLLLTNLFINGSEMGLLSVAKTLPAQISSLIGTVSGSFDPSMTIAYAKEDKTEFFHNTNIAMKMNGFLCSIPIIGVIVFGLDFYSLWMPTLSSAELLKVQILAVLTLLPQVMSVYVYPLYTVNTITCKLKVPVLLSLGIGVANIGIVFLLLKFTGLGVYAVAGVSSVLWLIRILTFVPLYAAHVLNVKWTVFYEPIVRGFINIAVVGSAFWIISSLTQLNSWAKLIIVCAIAAIIGYTLCFFIMFGRNERKLALNMIKSRFKRSAK